ncbi:putative oxidoreductase C-terminal domain-containing protein [Proteiniphilum sp. UBA5384]|uniref:putative oxidoreductase C-terminal domain-containing protein n=1 Tax=Proteiniphilum sp. UBA5384 TaxID=1947279 RepID=UPI0025CD907E|nr:putative oxidoreductase C-terminal domain-containing protein [Proteiniphilum sp. UBA5384]
MKKFDVTYQAGTLPIHFLSLVIYVMLSFHANAQTESTGERKNLMVLNPAHPHGAQIQNTLRSAFHADVHVYAPCENDLEESYLNTINRHNRSDTVHYPWQIHTYIGEDYMEKMLQDNHGDVVIIASNNRSKSDYILRAAASGLNVIADKPMALNSSDFMKLTDAFAIAETQDRFISDLPAMSMRYSVTCLLQKELAAIPGIFGTLKKGSAEDPAVVQENLHYYYKRILRPTWFFDVKQQGNGVTDVTTHLADLVLWSCFPEETVDYEKDIQIVSSKLWPITIQPGQFKKVTGIEPYPDSLTPYLEGEVLKVFSNGEIILKINETYVRLTARWDFEPPAGESDTHQSVLRGTHATLRIKPGHPLDLYIEPSQKIDVQELEKEIRNHFEQLKNNYPFISLHQETNGWRISTKRRAIKKETHINVPSQQEVSRMLAKYYITTKADAVAEKIKNL